METIDDLKAENARLLDYVKRLETAVIELSDGRPERDGVSIESEMVEEGIRFPVFVAGGAGTKDHNVLVTCFTSGERDQIIHDLLEARQEISDLRDAVVLYGDRVRMANAGTSVLQQATDRAFERKSSMTDASPTASQASAQNDVAINMRHLIAMDIAIGKVLAAAAEAHTIAKSWKRDAITYRKLFSRAKEFDHTAERMREVREFLFNAINDEGRSCLVTITQR